MTMKAKPVSASHMMAGRNKMTSMPSVVSVGGDTWKACGSFVKPAKAKHLEVKDTGCKNQFNRIPQFECNPDFSNNTILIATKHTLSKLSMHGDSLGIVSHAGIVKS